MKLVNSVDYVVEFCFLIYVQDYFFPYICYITIFLIVDQNFIVPESQGWDLTLSIPL